MGNILVLLIVLVTFLVSCLIILHLCTVVLWLVGTDAVFAKVLQAFVCKSHETPNVY